MKITKLGTDPEFFFKAGDKFKSSIPIVGMGTKEEPMPMDKDGFFFLHDNVTCELNVPPANNLESFTSNIRHGMAYIQSIIPNDYEIATEASAYFDGDELLDMKALEFGCTDSFNAWQNGEIMPRPNAEESNLRSCGGHIHIELDRTITSKELFALVKSLDLHVGVPSVLMDTDLYRRELYGKAGDFREKLSSNRFEYRVLSNFWIFDNLLIKWVWENVHKAVEFVTDGDVEALSKRDLSEDIVKAINSSDYSLAAAISKEYALDVTPIPVATVYK